MFGLVASCKDATAMSLDISTDVPCSSAVQVSVTAGAGANVEGVPPSVVTAKCEAGHIGTLTLVPNVEKNARITLRVVLAPNGNVEACNARNKYAGCIVGRRTLSYVSAKALRVPVSLLALCKDVPCTATSTCARTGLCVAAECSVRGDECVVDSERPDVGALVDAANDALPMGDAATGGGGDSGSTPNDAGDGGRDAGLVGDSGTSGGMVGVYCPGPAPVPAPVQCLVGDYCCYDGATTTGACSTLVDSDACISSARRPLRCDDSADCLAVSGDVCCTEAMVMSNGGSECVQPSTCTGQGGKVLCATMADCPAGFGFTHCAAFLGPYKRCF